MAFAGGDPARLRAASRALGTLAEGLTDDALAARDRGREAAAAAGDGHIAQLAESALAAVGGALVATAVVVSGLAQGTTTASDQLVGATGGPR
ncbi:hypothetical protein [Cellulomonas sp. KH9]|uniref:hypothetical protein n=1 Tax=Cellulomonas sp. KH9 TaxID=1855324 RepID=UPI0008DF0841|nr:hypothetical protein [Cellulomonas sp. KH9]SFJ62611.1 hypothetical protein SAMN05216467_0233 [Cellulomonas sp. KH9]